MRAIVSHAGVLEFSEAPTPVPGPHEVLIDVAAAGVNRADVLQRAGKYPPPAGASPILGLECSGTVVALGGAVTNWSVGDQVCALLPGGGYAEQVAVDDGLLLPVPAPVSLVEAAALPEAVATAWSNLTQVSGPLAGCTVLITGGSGGVGTMAIQLATRLGARVIGVAGGPDRARRLEMVGAWRGVDYRGDVPSAVAELTGGRGVDLILDVMGASHLQQNLSMLAPDGRLKIIGTQGGTHAQLDLAALLAGRHTITATTLRGRPLEQRRAIVADVREQVWGWLRAGQVRPVVDRTFPLPDAAAALALLEQGGQVFGKVVLTT